MKTVVLYSGGLDSFLTHMNLKFRKIDHSLLYFDLGGKYSKCERDLFNSEGFHKWVDEPVQISSNLMMGNLEDETAYIPNRNILAAIMAHSITDADVIYLGGTLSDRVNDNNPVLFAEIGKMLSNVHQKNIKIGSRFFKWHKPDIVKSFVLTNGFKNYETIDDAKTALVEATFSCYYPDSEDAKYYVTFFKGGYNWDKIEAYHQIEVKDNVCLECPACFRKNMSLFAGGIFVPMWNTDTAKETITHYYEEAKKHIHDHRDPMHSRYVWTLRYCKAVSHQLAMKLKVESEEIDNGETQENGCDCCCD